VDLLEHLTNDLSGWHVAARYRTAPARVTRPDYSG
jgi:hypothetical protein